MAELSLEEGVASLDAGEWNALVADGSPFLEWEWLSSLERAGSLDPDPGGHARPLVAREDGRLVAACPLYIKLHSEGEFVFDWSWADAAARAGIDYYPKILVGVPFTPVTGARLLVADGEDRVRWCSLLADALRSTCLGNDLSGVHVNFCLEDEARALESEGWMLRRGLQYHWLNEDFDSFDDYLARFRSKRRNQIRRERREIERQDVVIETFTGDEIPDELIGPMYGFYVATVRAHYWGRQYLNRSAFDELAERFRDCLVFVVARHAGEWIAGTFNVRKGDALYGRYWGATTELRHLHFNVCYYAAIEYCIEHGLSRFEPGAGGAYKQLRGFDARPTRSAHFISDPRLAAAIERFLEAERDEVGETIDFYNERSALKPG